MSTPYLFVWASRVSKCGLEIRHGEAQQTYDKQRRGLLSVREEVIRTQRPKHTRLEFLTPKLAARSVNLLL